jgi:hypothetical protein
MHGGKSTGPRTPEGLERTRRANWKLGYYTAEEKAARREGREAVRSLRRLLSRGRLDLLSRKLPANRLRKPYDHSRSGDAARTPCTLARPCRALPV